MPTIFIRALAKRLAKRWLLERYGERCRGKRHDGCIICIKWKQFYDLFDEGEWQEEDIDAYCHT
jgi:hypothetical protein